MHVDNPCMPYWRWLHWGRMRYRFWSMQCPGLVHQLLLSCQLLQLSLWWAYYLRRLHCVCGTYSHEQEHDSCRHEHRQHIATLASRLPLCYDVLQALSGLASRPPRSDDIFFLCSISDARSVLHAHVSFCADWTYQLFTIIAMSSFECMVAEELIIQSVFPASRSYSVP